MHPNYMQGVFDSCSNVIMPQSGQLVMEVMCATNEAAACTPEK
jgi:hypothetical protein